jgi:hypothetical protein
MQLINFLNKYEKHYHDLNTFKSESFKSDWNKIKNKYKDDIPSIRLLLEQLTEKRFPTFLIKELFNLHSDNDEIKQNKDLFKWAAAFHGKELINFLYENMEVKDEFGAVNAAIINFRLDNLKALSELGINVFNEKNFCQAINRSNQPKSPDIVNYYLENKDKFEISDYGVSKLKEHTQLIAWAIENEDFDKSRYLIEQGVGADRNSLLRSACMDASLNRVKYILESKDFDMLIDNKKLTSENLATAFMWAATTEAEDIVNYLIFDYKIPYFKEIKKEIKEHELDNVKKLFEIRKNHNALHKELSTQSEVVPKKKLKL